MLIAAHAPSHFVAAPFRRVAQSDPSPAASAPARDAGAFAGRVVSVDYRSGVMRVASSERTRAFTVLPSTQVQADAEGFRTIADIAVGSTVDVLASERDGTYTAQIVRLH